MPQPGRPGHAAAGATPCPATVHVGAEELEAGGDADVGMEVGGVGDQRRRLQLDVVAARSDAVEVFALSVRAAPVRTLVHGGVADKAVRDGGRRAVDGRACSDLVLAELVVGGGLGRPAAPSLLRPAVTRRAATGVLVRPVMLETREHRMR